jgi:hypothetical protein
LIEPSGEAACDSRGAARRASEIVKTKRICIGCTSSKRPISDVRAEKQLHVSPRRHLVTTAFLRVSN